MYLKVRGQKIHKSSPSLKGKSLTKGRKKKEGYLFSLDGIKKVKRNLGAKESFPVLLILCLWVFSQVHCNPNDKTKDSFEEAGNIGKIR